MRRHETAETPRDGSAALGPFLGLTPGGGVKVVVAVPAGESHVLRCTVHPAGGEVRERVASPTHGTYRVFTFEFDDLPPDAACRYELRDGDVPLDLGGLEAADLRFAAPRPFADDDTFLIVSCHEPFAEQPYPDAGGWDAWEALLARVDEDATIRFLVLAGDQLYNDDAAGSAFIRVRDGDVDGARGAMLDSYRRYWGDARYRRVMARLPSIAIWDDHDIIDGWGGRFEQFEGDSADVKPEWRAYFDVAREAFEALQASRNPNGPLPGAGEVQTTWHDFGDNRLVLLDLRTEKNARREPEEEALWSRRHEGAVMDQLTATTAQRLFVVSPVVPVRTNPGEDSRLSRLARWLFRLNQRTRSRPIRSALSVGAWLVATLGWLAAPAIVLPGIMDAAWLVVGAVLGITGLWGGAVIALSRVPHLPHVSDDITDGLTAAANRPSLVRLLRAAFAWRRRTGHHVAVLSGDVHLSGMSEILERRGGDVASIPQVVSSPVANAPMEKVVAGFTTTTSEIELDAGDAAGDGRLWARNVMYVSRRVFVQVRPAGLEAGETDFARYWLEGHAEPLTFPASFLSEPSASRPSVASPQQRPASSPDVV